ASAQAVAGRARRDRDVHALAERVACAAAARSAHARRRAGVPERDMSRLRRQRLHLPGAGGRMHAPLGTRAVVVGGGIAGIAAATSLVERGVHVVLLERESYLGGRAGACSVAIATGERIQLERGFHGFFRQYYNLRALLRRVDPELRQLTPLTEYPVLGS